MTRLVVVELRRLFARRAVVLAMVAALLVAAFVLFTTWSSVQPMSEAETEQAETFYEEARADWEENGDEYLADCREQEELERERIGEDVDFDCELQEPQREHFFFTSPPLEESLPGILTGVALVLVLLGSLVGATFIAAELSTGSMSNWLTFEPRRLRVYASKVIAAAAGVVPVAVGVLAVVLAGTWLIFDSQGLADSMTAAAWSSEAWRAVRIVVLTVVAAVAGCALGFLLRHTAAVMGVVLAYAVVVEGILTTVLPRFSPWSLQTNITGWIDRGTSYFTDECVTDVQGTICEATEHTVSFGHSSVYLLVLTLVFVVVAAVVFRERDAA